MSEAADGTAEQARGPATVDACNPWLGLVSFTEETRAYFHGRDEEVAELARRVQRRRLTVLFGKSGLGKTSILRAALAPKLREQGYCPVYVRIDYGRESPEPAEQIKDAIRRAANVSGHWTQVGVSAAGESLWEFLHHRDDVLRDAAGAALIPLLIFDQFEELFTLAQSDEFGRARATRFIEELADLVENRPPKAFEARLDQDDSAAERFDFERTDYRVLISLREDYLAPLESLKKTMPSLAQNRLRLGPMRGEQALEAVLVPGRGLLSPEVGAEIVRFVAGGAELEHAEVEPSLLSLICRELNDTRLAQGRESISLDLLAGSREGILSNFYERSLADQLPAVRRIVEDELLTESGFRENVAEETLLKHLAAAGAAPAALAQLVNRRLVRIEERLDVRRVELTHDVLCGVVKASRDQRHEREAREAAERGLEEQRVRERAARRALTRARAIAAGCILLAVVALAAAAFAFHAERQAERSRRLAEQARSHAERLLGYLAGDFDRELQSFGQLKIIAEFTERQIQYFHDLPAQLRSAQTVRYGALALIEHAKTLNYLGRYGTGTRNIEEAIGLLKRLNAGRNHSLATQVALGRAYTVRCAILFAQQRNGFGACQRAVALLKPLAEQPSASLEARQAYVETLTRIGWAEQTYGVDYAGAAQATHQAMQIAGGLGAKSLRNLKISADYAFAGAWRTNALVNLNRNADALRVGRKVLTVADGVLAQRPWYRLTLSAKEITDGWLVAAADGELDPRAGQQFALQEQQTARAFLKLDPGNVDMWNNLGLALTDVCVPQWAQGRLTQALSWCGRAFEAWAHVAKSLNGGFVVQIRYLATRMGNWQARAGHSDAARLAAARAQDLFHAIAGRVPPNRGGWYEVRLDETAVQAEARYERGDAAGAAAMAGPAIHALRSAKGLKGAAQLAQSYLLYDFSSVYGRAEYQLGHYAQAERAERIALAQSNAVAPFAPSVLAEQRDRAGVSTWLALALARQGKQAEARQRISPVVTFEEGLLARDHGDVWVPYELARALYAQSLADPRHRVARLARAAGLLDHLPIRVQHLHDVQLLRRRVGQGR